MDLTLSGLQWSLCLIYLDDVIVFSHDFDEYIARLGKVLTRISAAGLKLKHSECIFFASKVSFLGHIVSQDGVSPDPDNIAKIANWPTPRNVHEVCSILGMGNYYCRFVKDFSQVQPLVALSEKITSLSGPWSAKLHLKKLNRLWLDQILWHSQLMMTSTSWIVMQLMTQ